MKKAIKISSSLDWVNCLAHMLNLIVKRFIVKCKNLVRIFKQSSRELSAKLAEVIKTFNDVQAAEEETLVEHEMFEFLYMTNCVIMKTI